MKIRIKARIKERIKERIKTSNQNHPRKSQISGPKEIKDPRMGSVKRKSVSPAKDTRLYM